MRTKLLSIIFLAASTFTIMSCSDDDKAPTDYVAASAEGTYTDPRDGNEYKWVRYGNLEWMAENFRYDLNDESKCLVYDDEAEIGRLDEKKYGRLYTYTGAVEACPEGWRLPTDEDWKNLERQMGMSNADANKWDWRGNVAFRMMSIYDATPQINIQTAGYYTPHMVMGLRGSRYYGVYAYFWTSSVDEQQNKGNGFYIFRKFIYNSAQIFRQSTTSEYGMSVRYVRDAQ